MTCRTFALLTALLLPVAGGLPCMASTHEAKSEEPALALSVSYPARLAPVLLQPSRQTLRAMVSGLYAATTARFTTLSNATSITESLDALPVIGTMHRRGAVASTRTMRASMILRSATACRRASVCR